jgi:hypothetical protein
MASTGTAIWAAAAALAATNLYISVGLVDHLCCLPADVYAGFLFVIAGLCVMMVLDPQTLVAIYLPMVFSSEKKESHPLSAIWNREMQAFCTRGFASLNFMAGVGILISAMRISVSKRIINYDEVVAPTPQIFFDLMTGKLEINALLRTGAEDLWESKYGLACGLYTYGVFSVLVIRRALAARRFVGITKITFFVFLGLAEAACGQFFTERNMGLTALLLVGNVFWLFYCFKGNSSLLDQKDRMLQVFSMTVPTLIAVAAILCDTSAAAWFLDYGGVIAKAFALVVFCKMIRYDIGQQPVKGWRRLACEIFSYLVYLPVAGGLIGYGIVEMIIAAVRSGLGTDHMPPIDPTKSGRLEMDHFDLDSDLDFAMLRREYVDKSIPFVLFRSSGKPMSDLALPDHVQKESKEGSIRITYLPFSGKLPGLDEIVYKLLPAFTFRAYHPLWFSGRYKQGTAHIDLGPGTVNFYFMRSGMKDVIIVPTEVSRAVKDLARGMDGIHIDGSANPERAYLKRLEYYHQVTLKPQTMLVFNNSASIHHFCNIYQSDGSPPEALSIRMQYSMNADPRIYYNCLANPRLYWRSACFISHFMFVANGENREQDFK